MRQPANLCAAYNSVVRNIGRKVKIKTNLGRNKVDITEGIIRETYPCVFLVELSSEPAEPTESAKTLSFSYTDVLTKDVELVFC
ncbi:MAG: Veg family protein [Lachnospiraceae bacterium]|nr:Veg family protein [Lachnospiraceae bacterium]